MARHFVPALLLLVVLAATPAAADRRAASVDVAGGLTATPVSAPGAQPAKSTASTSASVWLGLRYALSNQLELTATGFYEPSVAVYQNGMVLHDAAGDFPGTLAHGFGRVGGQGGARFVTGLVWRFVAGLEVGAARRSWTNLAMLDDRIPTSPVDYGLTIPNRTDWSFVLAPTVGVEWAGGDHWSIAVLPRAQLLLAKDVSWAVVLPLQFSWSWYL